MLWNSELTSSNMNTFITLIRDVWKGTIWRVRVRLEKKCFQGENLDSNIGLRLFSRSARLQVRLCFPTLGAGERRPVSKVWSHPCAAAFSALSLGLGLGLGLGHSEQGVLPPPLLHHPKLLLYLETGGQCHKKSDKKAWSWRSARLRSWLFCFKY